MNTEEQEESYSHILKYTGIFGGVQGLNILVGVIRNKFTALFLGPSGMGLLSLFNSTTNFVSSSTNLGIQTSGVKIVSDTMTEPSRDAQADAVCMVRSFSLVAAMLGLIVCAVLGPLLNSLTFYWGDHTLHFVLLSPTVFFTILAGGETAILKATRQLKALAAQASLLALLSLFISVPIYWLWGESGIIGVLFLTAFSQWALALHFSRRVAPLRLCLNRGMWSSGIPMLRLGIAFMLASMMNSGAEFLIRSYLNMRGSLEIVGLFNAGVTIAIIYTGMIFSVMESDYYPRLSAIRHKGEEMNTCVNRQLEMNIMLIGPIVIALIIGLPIIIPLLYNAQFIGMLGMTQVAALGMLFKAMYLPIEYLPLSRGESKVFLVQESFCVLLLIVCEIAGYNIGNATSIGCLTGIGGGIVVAYMVESIAVLVFAHWHYDYRMSKRSATAMLFHSLCGLLALHTAFTHDSAIAYWTAGIAIFIISLIYSARAICKSLK
jgi:O-antigen/teichoic acid export membrane protein